MPEETEPISRLLARKIEQDSALAEVLARGVVNLRALARWLIRTNHWAATEDAVLSALRRYVASSRKESSVEQARALLSRAHLNTRSRVCLVTLPKSKGVQQAVGSLITSLDYSKGEILRLIQTERGIKVLIDETNLPKLQRAVGASVQSVEHNLTELNVVVSEETMQTPGVLALIFGAIASRGINVVESVSGLPEHLVFVAEKDAMDAYDALAALTRPASPTVRVVHQAAEDAARPRRRRA